MIKRKFDFVNMAKTTKKPKHNINIDEVFQYCLMPSLQHMSAVNIVVTLWSRKDIKNAIIKLFDECDDDGDDCDDDYDDYDDYGGAPYRTIDELWKKIDDKVLREVSQLPVPKLIRNILSNIIHPVRQEMFNWLKYKDRCIFNYSNFYTKSKLAINYIDNLVWTSRGRIDYKETAKFLLAKEELSDDYKYSIACANCFEDKIAIIAPNVMFDETLNELSFEHRIMVYFWDAHITGNFTKLDNEIYSYNYIYETNYTTNECIFKMLIHNLSNPVSIKYIWDTLNEEEKSRQIVPAIQETSNTDIRCFLLSQMSKEQEKDAFKNHDASKILLCFLDDWLWGHYFLPTLHHIWDIISGSTYLAVLETIKNKICEYRDDIQRCNPYKAIFKESWKCAPKHLKEYFVKHFDLVGSYNIFFELFYIEDVDLIQLMLSDFNDIEKKKMMFSFKGINECHEIIKSNRWDILDSLIGSTLFSEEDIKEFKLVLLEDGYFFKSGSFYIVVCLMQNEGLDKVEQLLKWAFQSDDEIKEFKQKLAFSKICSNILNSIVENRTDLPELQYFFEWCSSGNHERVIELKEEIPEHYFDEVICRLIMETKYKLLEQILSWCFSNREQIIQFKQYYCQEDTINEIVLLVVNLIKKDDQLQSLTNFVYYLCSTDEEINKFKKYILQREQNAVDVCICLFNKSKFKLEDRMFKLADEFLNWCNPEQLKIDTIKNELMTCEIIDEYVFEQYNYDTRILEEVVKWCNPSFDTIIKFKYIFRNSWWLEKFLPIFDNYIQEQEYNKDTAINNEVNYTLQGLLTYVENQDNTIINENVTKSYRRYY